MMKVDSIAKTNGTEKIQFEKIKTIGENSFVGQFWVKVGGCRGYLVRT